MRKQYYGVNHISGKEWALVHVTLEGTRTVCTGIKSTMVKMAKEMNEGK
jgi:hypothetical protein